MGELEEAGLPLTKRPKTNLVRSLFVLNVVKTLKRIALNASPVSNGSTMFALEYLRRSIKFLIIYQPTICFSAFCRPKLDYIALKFFNEIEEKQKFMGERI